MCGTYNIYKYKYYQFTHLLYYTFTVILKCNSNFKKFTEKKSLSGFFRRYSRRCNCRRDEPLLCVITLKIFPWLRVKDEDSAVDDLDPVGQG